MATFEIVIPDNYESTGEFRVPLIGERYLSGGGRTAYAGKKMTTMHPIIRKQLPPMVQIELKRESATAMLQHLVNEHVHDESPETREVLNAVRNALK